MKSVIILLGPTGVGKTGASLLLAKKLDTEIISADSMQIYRRMDIGTAKPTVSERAAVRHHMIDVADPSDSFSAGRYVEAIVSVIDDLHARGKVPLITGGTGLYIKAITRGIFSGPSADWQLRDRLLEDERENPGILYDSLVHADPDSASRIEKNDTRRIIRALEVCRNSSGTMSEMQEKFTSPLPYSFIKIGLTRERGELYAMIDRRVDAMLSDGLLDEVTGLLSSNPGQTPMQAIGYKELTAYIRGEVPFPEAVRLIKRNTRRYAKRQFTWFAKEAGIKWIDVTGVLAPEAISEKIIKVLDNS